MVDHWTMRLVACACFLLGCGGIDPRPAFLTEPAASADGGTPPGAGGAAPNAGGMVSAGGTTPGAGGRAGGRAGAIHGGAGGTPARSDADSGMPACLTDRDCPATWHCGEARPKSGQLTCHMPCHVPTTGTAGPDGYSGCERSTTAPPEQFCAMFIGLSEVNACVGIAAGASRYCAVDIAAQDGCPTT